MKIDEQLLRRLMCHSDKTANEWYLRESLTQESVEASVLIDQQIPNCLIPPNNNMEKRKRLLHKKSIHPK